MKFLVAIAMIALIGCSFTSAAAIDMGDDFVPESMGDFEENLKNMLLEVSEQIKESADFDSEEEFKNFLQENKVNEDDNEQTTLVTEEAENLSAVEEDTTGENVDSGISCRWHGRSGACCQSLRIIRWRISICLVIQIHPPTYMRVALRINGHTIWRKSVGSRRSYRICYKRSGLKLCVHLYGLSISRHSARICLAVSARWHFIRFGKRLGCLHKRFAASEQISSTGEKETPLLLAEKPENVKHILTTPQEENWNDDVLRFDQ